jgi:hypothetical protein
VLVRYLGSKAREISPIAMRQPGWKPQGDMKRARGGQLIKANLYTDAARSANAIKGWGC